MSSPATTRRAGPDALTVHDHYGCRAATAPHLRGRCARRRQRGRRYLTVLTGDEDATLARVAPVLTALGTVRRRGDITARSEHVFEMTGQSVRPWGDSPGRPAHPFMTNLDHRQRYGAVRRRRLQGTITPAARLTTLARERDSPAKVRARPARPLVTSACRSIRRLTIQPRPA
jgi:hypothetical protein